MGCDCLSAPTNAVLIFISIRAPVWGAIFENIVNSDRYKDFNPRTRVGCDLTQLLKSVKLLISIRAPVWGAIHLHVDIVPLTDISIRAPVWGAILAHDHHHSQPYISIRAPVWGAITHGQRHNRTSGYFNPRTRVGCDFTRHDIVAGL